MILPSVLWHCWLGGRKGMRPVKHGGWWRWALYVSPDGVALSRMVTVSASVNLPLHHKVQKFSSGTDWAGRSRKKGRKTVVVVCGGTIVMMCSTYEWMMRRRAGGHRCLQSSTACCPASVDCCTCCYRKHSVNRCWTPSKTSSSSMRRSVLGKMAPLHRRDLR